MKKKEFLEKVYLLQGERRWKILVTNHKFKNIELDELFRTAKKKKKHLKVGL